MNIDWNEEEVEFLRSVLSAVDKKALDPVYGNLLPRMVLKEAGVNIETAEVNSLIEALTDYADEGYIRDASDEDRKTAEEHLNKIQGMGFVI
jgi:hypothetical protein